MERHNLLFIYTDQQRFDTLAAYGNDRLKMDNLNALANRSVVFEKTYVTQPVCTPSRSTLLTGQWPHSNGCVHNNIALDAQTRCLPEMLDDDYVCAHYGKWHLGDEIYSQHGFDRWVSTEDMYRSFYSEGHSKDDKSQYWHWLAEKGIEIDVERGAGRLESNRLNENLTKPAYLAEVSNNFIEENKDNPFVLYINFLQPHTPYSTCYDDKYVPEDIPLPETFGDTSHSTTRAKIISTMLAHGAGSDCDGEIGSEPEKWRKYVSQYWGSCTLVDTYTGKILDKLKECGLEDKTIIVFTSDHGDMMANHSMLHKSVMYEEATKVPFLLSLPGQRDQIRVAEPVSQIDMVPTLLDLMGAAIPEQVQGHSLREYWETGATSGRDVIIEWNPGDERPPFRKGEMPEWLKHICTEEEAEAVYQARIRTIVTADGWKFNWSTIGENELFNLENDPYERNNLYGIAEHDGLVMDLKMRIKEWQKDTADNVVL
ncbi:MAG: sulfatase-like hydrolase/transferase [Planctomycetes bacterium]|nr:sulfatase-like hydrolase/transferase [Planctomycetota bacterium]